MTQNTSWQTCTTKPKSMRLFLIIWGGQVFSLLGSRLVQFALIWHLTTTTSSAMVLAIASIMGLLPQTLLGPIAGVLVDRWNRRVVMIVADSFIAVVTLLLALFFLFDWVQVWLIYLAMFIRSLGGAFHSPAMIASTPLLVPEKHLTRIGGMNQSLQGTANIVAPLLGALLLELLPIQGILAIDVGTAIIAIMPLLFIHIPNPIRKDLTGREQENRPSVLDDLQAGLAFVWGWRGLRILVALSLVINLVFAPAISLLPIMIKETFGGGALELAWVQGGWGLGIIFGGMLLGIWGGFKNRIMTGLIGLFLQSIGFLVVGFMPASALFLLVIAMGFIGIMNAATNGSFFAALQVAVPNEIQGRILTLVYSSLNVTMPIGLLIAGLLAERVGVQVFYVFSGIVMLLISMIFYFTPSVFYFEARGKQMVNTHVESDQNYSSV